MRIRLSLIFIILTAEIFSQPSESLNSAEIKLALKKLHTVGSVLYIAAHPDDENTAFLTYFNYGRNLRTGYLSLTRGDGGQNLIGDEQGDLLGVIRTQELLQARGIDGAEQFFTRAVDFGYSKTPEETLNKWGKQEILSDIVWIIRKFRPDVIVTRFPTTGIGTHGHHTASAILAVEAFNISGDSSVFPEQLKYVKPWRAKRIFWNAWIPALTSMGINIDTLIKINFGEYNQLLGRSYTEISAESRTMHKSQGFGDTGRRENYYNYFLQLAGEPAENDLFEDIDLSWERVEGSEKVSELLNRAENDFNFENPSKVLPTLIKAYKELQKNDDDYWVSVKSEELIKTIKSCAGIWLEAVTNENLLSPGCEILVKAGLVNRSEIPMTLKSIQIDYQNNDSTLNAALIKGSMISVERKIFIPQNVEYSQPYWLQEGDHKDKYVVNDIRKIGQPKTDYPLYASFKVDYEGNDIVFKTPVFFRETDPVEGEVYKSIEIVPEAYINFDKELYLIKNDESKKITVFIKSIAGRLEGKVRLLAEDGWNISPAYYEFSLNSKGQELEYIFTISSANNNSSSVIKAQLEIDGKKISKSLTAINYPHIQQQTVLKDASARILKIDLYKTTSKKIAYIMGSGDKIPDLLRDLGFTVDVFYKEPLTNEVLNKYELVIAGIRAYNTYSRLSTDQQNLIKYVEDGGTLLVQYNTLGDLIVNPSPYNLKISRDRVTEEDSPVKILNEQNPLLNYPYKIILKDFSGWIQERGLYFPNEWDENFQTLIEMYDTGENPKAGAILAAKYGKGTFIYTGLSFFRQLPAGVEGAYKLFINLMFAGIYE